jgi:hypothetical protein
MKHKITAQHSYSFSETGESVTAYVSDTTKGLFFGLSFQHNGSDIKWTGHYQGILQIQSKVNPLIWYIYLSAYWEGQHAKDIPVERVMMVSDCTVQPTK